MAAPIFRNEFEERMRDMIGFMKTSIDAAKYDIIANTNAKCAAIISHFDEQIATLRQETATLRQDGERRERKLDAVLKALNVTIEDL